MTMLQIEECQVGHLLFIPNQLLLTFISHFSPWSCSGQCILREPQPYNLKLTLRGKVRHTSQASQNINSIQQRITQILLVLLAGHPYITIQFSDKLISRTSISLFCFGSKLFFLNILPIFTPFVMEILPEEIQSSEASQLMVYDMEQSL